MEYIGWDAHKKYSLYVRMGEDGRCTRGTRVEHGDRQQFRAALHQLPAASPIAVETSGSWYWLVDELEQAGHYPILTDAGKAKRRMGETNKTDRLDARGLAMLLRNGTLPAVWIPPGEVRDQRELVRTRMALVRMRTRLKNRLAATWNKYGLEPGEASRRRALPAETARCVEIQETLLAQVHQQVAVCERRLLALLPDTPARQLLMSLPGIGRILGAVLAWEIGDIDRFAGPGSLANYAGLVPTVHASGGKRYLGPVRKDANHYLKWAYVEAANVIVTQQEAWAQRHVVRLYRRLRGPKGHAKAVVAVARHLAEASYWMLKKQEPYREPRAVSVPPPESAKEH